MSKVYCENCRYCHRDFIGVNDDGSLMSKLPNKMPHITEDPDCKTDPIYEMVPESFLRPAYKKVVRYVKCKSRNCTNDCPLYSTYMGE